MNFTLTINGETPAELLATLQQLSIPAALQQPQSDPAPQPEKPKAPAPARQKKPAEKPAAAPVEKQPEPPTEEKPQANPTVPAEPAADSPAATSAQPGTGGSASAAPSETTATPTSSEPEKDPLTENKIRDLIMALMRQGKRAECQKIITGTGAKGISSLPPESYTVVWEQLLKLKDEVDDNAAG